MTRRVRLALALTILAPVALGACVAAKPASISGMTAPNIGAAPPGRLEHSMTVGVVSGGESTNPLWTSEVGNEEFRTALEDSLRNFALLAAVGPDGSYVVDAHLVNVDQPMMSFDTTVTSTVAYRIRASGSPEVLLEETVIAPYTASASETFFAIERLRIANEGSIRKNIEMFIERLRARMQALPV